MYQQSLRKPFGQCGQWIWNSETINFDSSIPWNIETYNTDGNNFIWEMNSNSIKVHNEGIYELSFAFFTKVKPTIKLIINGETVVSAINSSSYVVHHSSGYVLANGKIKPGSSIGLSLLVIKYLFIYLFIIIIIINYKNFYCFNALLYSIFFFKVTEFSSKN